ncbi:hypothetical protein K501DRAFT_331180 [Backusella circina FSU 941]|nr:hypothetical protein K501DRAFT_331180 [Backusella circina FSU 941]
MIPYLPVEIIVSISSHLSFQDKLNLSTTCRKLNTLISKANLYSELNLQHDDNAEMIIKKFESKQYNGTQVKTLSVNMYKLNPAVVHQLHTIFPNITRVASYQTNKYPLISPMSKWVYTIEKYNTQYDWYEIWVWLEQNTFPRLTELEIVDGFALQEPTKGLHRMYFHPFIRNAPALRKLELSKCVVGLELLESTHTECPCIKSLILKSTIIVIQDNTQPQLIKPANSVIELSLDNVMVSDGQKFFLHYILNKYPDIQSLTFGLADFLSEVHEHIPNFEGSRDEYDIKNFILGFCNCRLRGAEFIKRLPKTLKKLKLDISNFDHVLESLSQSGLKLTHLEFKDNEFTERMFEDGAQLDSLRSLISLKTLVITIITPIQHFEGGILSNSITKLVVKFERGPPESEDYHLQLFYLDWVLSRFPSLESLYIDYSANFVIHPKRPSHGNTYPHLRVLSIKNCSTAKDEILSFLRSSTPNIEEIYLDFRYHLNFEMAKEYIDLSGWNSLNKLHLSLPSDDSDLMNEYSFNITVGRTTRLFNFIFCQDTVSLLPKKYRLKNLSRVARLDLTCDETHRVTIGDFGIKKVGNELVVS